ncbi:Embryogenesis-associated protein EMB8 [Apostasia shenzhenica]|uniref:Embryogenesis-associated protein EMB8 n=1 Tax=Apostasia shenzhenica TaxID=1088818 RepID=A0A2I0AS48_9ASPA|nr:Embryogenesis-associated protein EMB8 [Apostasia shenzhenica]
MAIPEGQISAAELLLMAASMVQPSHYLMVVVLVVVVFLYKFLEFHILGDFFRGFRGDPVSLIFDPGSKIYEDVVSKCRIIHGRYLATPWLSSPHFQTSFLNFFGRPPHFIYRRQLFSVHDGGTIALDWLFAFDGSELQSVMFIILLSEVGSGSSDDDAVISKDDTTPIVVVVPGLTSDSASAYIKHIAYNMAKRGWNVVVGNHRGLGGVSITVKYLGEEGESTPISGAASICSPWDLVVCDRFISRNLVQRLYDKALTIGLKGYAQLHQPVLARLANWDGIRESRSVRDFDHHATRHVGKFETVDTYYRRCSSVSYLGNVCVPLLCISALDDPVCTKEAIPWDECRANRNVVLAATTHGGHLAYFEGISASSLWWVRAADEFLAVLHSSPYLHVQKLHRQHFLSPRETSIDKSPYVNITEDGLVPAIKDGSDNEDIPHQSDETAAQNEIATAVSGREHTVRTSTILETTPTSLPSDQNGEEEGNAQMSQDAPHGQVRSSLNQLAKQSKKSMWLLLYIAIMSSWPLVGSTLLFLFRNKLKVFSPGSMRRRQI